MLSDWLVFCDCGFHSVCPLMEKDEAYGSFLMGETDWGGNWVLSWWAGPCSLKFNPIFCWWWGCVPSLLFDLRPNCGGGNEDNGDLLQKVPCISCNTQFPQLCSRPPPTHTSAGDSWTLTGKTGSVSYGVTAPFSWVLVHTRFCLCPPQVCFPVLCTFWRLFGGVNGDLLQEGLCHTQVCCTQSLCPCNRPLLTRTSSGDSHTRFCLSLCGISGSWCTQGMFEPSEGLWQVWGLILNVISPLLLSYWGFSFALGCGVSLGCCFISSSKEEAKVGASLIAQLVKNPPAMQETLVWFLGWDLLEEEWATYSSILGLPLWLSW